MYNVAFYITICCCHACMVCLLVRLYLFMCSSYLLHVFTYVMELCFTYKLVCSSDVDAATKTEHLSLSYGYSTLEVTITTTPAIPCHTIYALIPAGRLTLRIRNGIQLHVRLFLAYSRSSWAQRNLREKQGVGYHAYTRICSHCHL